MGFFDIFSKKESQGKATSLDEGLLGLQKGGYVSFDLETYRVEKRSCYEEDGERALEWHLVGESNQKHMYLGYEKDDGKVYWFLTEKVKASKIAESDWDRFTQDDAPPKITIDDQVFLADASGAAYFYADDRDVDREELIYWNYEDRDGELILTIEQWGETAFEVYQGKYVTETDFYNIIQGDPS
ncbi:MAG: DUF4178 domain-containing protein [Pseudobacteriovorax sp.]|nr:DUF4178 domain-containing protein [Pseudobacteriovorax sp.]